MTTVTAPFPKIKTLEAPNSLEVVTMKFLSVLSVLFLTLLIFGCGYSSNNGVRPSTANVATLAPDSENAGAAAFVLTVNGIGFAANSVVFFNAASVSTTYVNAQQLTANIQAADIATAGTISVYVNNPGTGQYATGVNSNSVPFTIN